MKIKVYLFFPLLFLVVGARGQDCTGLTFTCTTTESRCVATGSIMVNITGGSGNFNFKAVGAITTPSTSSNIITGLAPGYYQVTVQDLDNNCSSQKDSVYIAGSYSDPRFQLTKTDVTCAGNDGTISAVNQQYGRSPFLYTIVAPSPSNVGVTSSTGNFSGLIAGEYIIQLQDSCGGIQARRITVEDYNWWYDSVSVVRVGCDMADVFIRIRDNKGNVNTVGTGFSGFEYGYVNGDTTWYGTNNFSLFLGTNRSLSIVVKDDCGNVHPTAWTLPDDVKPTLAAVNLTNLACTNFTASISGFHLTSPNFCLYDTLGALINCNTTGVFNSLPYGSYCIQAYDACYDTTITRCFTASRPIPGVDDSVTISNRNCSTFTATMTGGANLTSPDFCLYDMNDVQISCNSTGVFNDLPYGTYCIKVHDACTDTLITRCLTATRLTPTLTNYSFLSYECNSFEVQVSGDNLVTPNYCIYDNDGNLISCDSSGIFGELPYGEYCIRAISCGDTTNSLCFNGSRPTPSVDANVQITQRNCGNFSAAVTGQTNLTTPQYCLYDVNDVQVACNSSGIFENIPYGSYCIKIETTCYDTTIVRCFAESQPVPSVNSTMQYLSSICTTVSFQANGNNLTNPTYCLYNSSNTLLACNSTGVFNNYPFGQYCVTIQDGCLDTLMQVCQTFTLPRGITLSTSKSCTINSTNIDVQFENGNSPYVIKVYHPNGLLVRDTLTSGNPFRIEMPALPAGTQYKIVGTDNCGNKDSASITPEVNRVTRQTSVQRKCPGGMWLNGSGDILANCNSNHHSVIPQIIKKNGALFTRNYSSVISGTYTFADLEPAQYIVEYVQSSCNGKLYDTITVSPYAYPSQGQSAVYQCDNNGFSLSADVAGGVSPYSFEIIGSLPETPSIVTLPQNSAVFGINNGTNYSLVRLRTIDACGNATLSDVSVLPLQNISIAATDSCFYQNITLSVNSTPNASYKWYRKTTPTDSTLLDSTFSYNLPFFLPEQIGRYICKVDINNGCLTRLTSFDLTGDCYGGVLPLAVQLNGRQIGSVNQLFWNNSSQRGVLKYLVERRQMNESSYAVIGTVPVQQGSGYFFNDDIFSLGTVQYRLKIVYLDKTEYSNVVVLRSEVNEISVYPNPVNNEFKISFNAPKTTDYKIELISLSGQLFYKTEAKNVTSATVTYTRDSKIKPGLYLLRVTDKTTGTSVTRKLVFE